MTKKETGKTQSKVKINYKKTDSYRSYLVDGIFGGLTPSGKLYVELFTERQVTPQSIEYLVAEDGKLGQEIKREGKEGLVRQIEAGLVMDVDMAEVLIGWLREKLELHKVNAQQIAKVQALAKKKMKEN